MDKKIILPLVFVGGALALFLLGAKSEQKPTPAGEIASIKPEKPIPLEETTVAPAPKKAKEEASKYVNIKHDKPKKEKEVHFKEKIVADYAFEPMEISEALAKRPHKKKVEPLAAFHYKKGTIRSLHYGDEITIPDVEGIDYALKISERKLSKRGNVSLRASLIDEEGVKTESILTEGKRVAFITLNTPNGTYEVESFDGVTYIYSSSDIRNNMIDFSKSDVVHIGHTH